MKILQKVIIILAFHGLTYGQTCSIPSLRGLKLGMTTQAVDALVVSENDVVVYDDARYTLSFTRNKLVRISAEYPGRVAENDIQEFVDQYAKKLNLPIGWKVLDSNRLLQDLQARRAALLTKYISEHPSVIEVEQKIKAVRYSSGPSLQCPQFNVSVTPLSDSLLVTFRLTNRSDATGKFNP